MILPSLDQELLRHVGCSNERNDPSCAPLSGVEQREIWEVGSEGSYQTARTPLRLVYPHRR